MSFSIKKKFFYLVPDKFDNPLNLKTEFFIIQEMRKKNIEIITSNNFRVKSFEIEKNIDGIIFSSLKVIWKEQKMIKYANKNSINIYWWYFDTAATSIRRKYKVNKIARQVSIFFNKDLLRFYNYEKSGINPIWLDQGVPNICVKNKKPNYKYDVSFFGSFEKSHSDRINILKNIDKKFNLVVFTKDIDKFISHGFKNVKPFIPAHKISNNLAKINLVLNGNFNSDYCWSNRVHLMIGSSGFTLVEKIKGLKDFYKNNEHCIYFDSEKLEKIINLWNQKKQNNLREKIRISGFNHAQRYHSYEKRVEFFINTINNFSYNES